MVSHAPFPLSPLLKPFGVCALLAALVSASLFITVGSTGSTTEHADARPVSRTSAQSIALPSPAAARSDTATAVRPPAHAKTYSLAAEDIVVSDPLGVRFVKTGDQFLTSPYTKIRPVTYKTAPEDLMVKQVQGPLHLVRRGETYMDEAGTYVEPVVPLPAAQITGLAAQEYTVIVGKNGLIVVRTGEGYRVGPYTKARPAQYRTAPEDLSVSDNGGVIYIVPKGAFYLDDLTTYAEPYHTPTTAVTPVAFSARPSSDAHTTSVT